MSGEYGTTYTPPPGPPPSQTHAVHYAPPPGLPPPQQYLQTAPSGADPASTEPPPPYTAKASDPLPSWAQASASVRDLSARYPIFAPDHVPLDPPPPFFSTPSPRRIRSRSFAPWTVPSRGRNIADGFPVLYNDVLKTHGIAEDDWARFVRDLQVAARLSLLGLNMRGERQRRASLSGGILGSVRGRAYDAAFVKSPLEQVDQLVQIYNGSAWERRKVRVTVRMQFAESGRERYELLVEAL
ncbi:uncharacterized protein PHACADRAFT_175484 [Phanerochaete carnosa HHB-10118-sp]|uniref:Uncharacterized protein n=1 Tax=Phanerochaete carnosa (strain HHB-10118-sp) TaxID=650164 RepID=K5WRP9_PHACS|nr:uncharacterized protein PHACADRAFT_175484 [Phanerochaete carnosa HHB-10118-sp]EKM53062.1 hypothetical protein PHACADRAFT_175484 [Phanerochaete carnosa HHB-10118-sp]